MTRVEKYRSYRNEILNMKFETSSHKREVAKRVSKVHPTDLDGRLNYEQVIDIHEMYGNDEKLMKKKKYHYISKYEIFYYSFALCFIIAMILALVFTGIKLWR